MACTMGLHDQTAHSSPWHLPQIANNNNIDSNLWQPNVDSFASQSGIYIEQGIELINMYILWYFTYVHSTETLK